jgi:hypothetical protein
MRADRPLRSRTRWRLLVVGAVVAAVTLLASGARAGEPVPAVQSLRLSTDISFDANPGPAVVEVVDTDVVHWVAGVGLQSLTSFPASNEAADLDAFHEIGGGFRLLSYDIAVVLDDGTVAHPADIVMEGPEPAREQTLFFDHRRHDIADSADIDAIAIIAGENVLVLSFATTTTVLAGQPEEFTVGDGDLAALAVESGELEKVFDAAEVGIPAGVGIDALDIQEETVLISFDVDGTLNGIGGTFAFADEDVVGFRDGWFMVWDGSVEFPGLEPADLDALSDVRVQGPPPTATAALPTSTATASATATRTATATAALTASTNTPIPATATITPSVPVATATASVPVVTATAPVATASATVTRTALVAACVGDCDHNNEVGINELIIGVNIALGNTLVIDCPSFDADADESVEINELIQAVNNALNGCS